MERTAQLVDRLRRLKLVPVIVIDDAEDAPHLARALSEGGLPIAEVTFRTAAGAEAIRRIAGECPDVLPGAGTVLTPQQARDAVGAGARFIVSPGFGPAVVEYCLEREIPVFPGICTPTEVEMALARGLTTLKFFPAEAAGGVGFLRAMASPYGMVSFIPTGGIGPSNLASYLGLKKVVACGGSWMAPAAWIREKRFDLIRAETAKAVSVARAAAGGEP